MHCKTLLTLGTLVIATLAQDYGLSTTLITITSTICNCDVSTTSNPALPTLPPATSKPVLLQGSLTTHSLTNITSSLSNLSTTAAAVIHSSSVPSAVYANKTMTFFNTSSTAIPSSNTNTGIPTSILFAPGPPPTVTSFTVITPTRTVTTTSSTASPAAANVGRSVSYPGIAMALLSLSSLLLR